MREVCLKKSGDIGKLFKLKVCLNCRYFQRKGVHFYCSLGETFDLRKVYLEVHPLNRACKDFEEKRRFSV